MFDAWQAFASDDQKTLLAELYDKCEELSNAQLHLMQLKKKQLQNPTAENQTACDEHASMFTEKLMADREDIVQRLLASAVDLEKLQSIFLDVQPLLKARLSTKLGEVISAKLGPLVLDALPKASKGDLSGIWAVLADGASLQSLQRFGVENLRDIMPMLASLLMDAVNVRILLEIFDAIGVMPSRKLSELLDKFLNEGVPRGL